MAKRASNSGKSQRGRKPIFSEAQKRVLSKMLARTLQDQLRKLARSLGK